MELKKTDETTHACRGNGIKRMLTKIGLEITQQESNVEILNMENQLIITKDRSKIPKIKKGNLKPPK